MSLNCFRGNKFFHQDNYFDNLIKMDLEIQEKKLH